MPKITQQSTAKKNKLELPYASRTIQAGNGSPKRRKALSDISHRKNTPIKPIDTKNSSFSTVPSNAIHVHPSSVSVSNSNSRPLRNARRISKKLDFRGEEEFFNEPASIVQNDLDSFMEFETILSPAVPVYIDNESDAKEENLCVQRHSSSDEPVEQESETHHEHEEINIDSVEDAVIPNDFEYSNQLIQVNAGQVNLKALPNGKRLHGKIVGDGACLFRSVSYSICQSQSLYLLYREKALEFILDHAADFEADIQQMTQKTVHDYVAYMNPDYRFGDQIMVIALSLYLNVSVTVFQKGLTLIDSLTFSPRNGIISQHVDIYLDLYNAHYDCLVADELGLPNRNQQYEMPSAASLDADDRESMISFEESCDLNEFSDSDFETSSIASSLDGDVSDMSDDDVQPAVKRVRTSLPPTAPSSTLKKDNRPFAQFMEEEGLVEVVRNWKKYPQGSSVVINADGALWIADEKTHVVISKATQEIMKKEGVWGKSLFIGKHGYIIFGANVVAKLHFKIASSKKDNDFRDLLQSGWKGKKDELEVLHLDDNSYKFNIENLHWNTHSANLLLKLSYGTPKGKKFQCSSNINGKNERTFSCPTRPEARHASDVLKISNVENYHQDLVFNHGMNFTYPSLQALLSRTHLYKSKPSHQGKPFISTGIIKLLSWKYADAGLKKAVKDSKVPFDSNLDVLVKYVAKKGKGVSLMFVMELECYNKHILNQQVSLSITNHGYVEITKEGYRNGIHRLVLGLKTSDKAKVGRHRVDDMDGKRDNRKRVLRSGNHASNMRDISKKTAASSSQFDGVTWDIKAQKWKAQICFSNSHVKFKKNLGRFGTKGDKSTGEKEANEWLEKVKENVEQINERLKDVTIRADFLRRVNEEIKKLR